MYLDDVTGDQVIVVSPNGLYLREDVPLYDVVLYEKKESWRKIYAVHNGRAGRHGLNAHRVANDGTTPIGLFELKYAFGEKKALSQVSTAMPTKVITPSSYWGGDDWGDYANRWCETDHPLGKDYEHLADYQDRQYALALVIGYNYDHFEKGKGTAIFFHCVGEGNTAGCVAVEKEDMKIFLEALKPHAYIMIKK